MEQMELTFVNPAGATLTAQLEPDMTADEAVAELISENFIAAAQPNHSWALFSPGHGKVSGTQTLGASGLQNGDSVTLMDVIQAGANTEA